MDLSTGLGIKKIFSLFLIKSISSGCVVVKVASNIENLSKSLALFLS